MAVSKLGQILDVKLEIARIGHTHKITDNNMSHRDKLW